MTFPTVEEIEFFTQPEVMEFFGAKWRPRIGDWYIETEQSPNPWAYETEDIGTVSASCFSFEPKVYGEPRGKPLYGQPNREPQILYDSAIEMVHGVKPFNKDEMGNAWLPRPDQLIEMLEKKGYNWELMRRYPLSYPKDPPYYLASIMRPNKGYTMQGPTAAIALAKCAMEIG